MRRTDRQAVEKRRGRGEGRQLPGLPGVSIRYKTANKYEFLHMKAI